MEESETPVYSDDIIFVEEGALHYVPNVLAALGVPDDASLEDVVKAYRRACLLVHPDKGGSVAEFQHLTLLFNRVNTEEKLIAYKAYLQEKKNDLIDENFVSTVHTWYDAHKQSYVELVRSRLQTITTEEDFMRLRLSLRAKLEEEMPHCSGEKGICKDYARKFEKEIYHATLLEEMQPTTGGYEIELLRKGTLVDAERAYLRKHRAEVSAANWGTCLGCYWPGMRIFTFWSLCQGDRKRE
eukprot:jgi/Mesvir1/1225/Mv17710-RA.1